MLGTIEYLGIPADYDYQERSERRLIFARTLADIRALPMTAGEYGDHPVWDLRTDLRATITADATSDHGWRF